MAAYIFFNNISRSHLFLQYAKKVLSDCKVDVCDASNSWASKIWCNRSQLSRTAFYKNAQANRLDAFSLASKVSNHSLIWPRGVMRAFEEAALLRAMIFSDKIIIGRRLIDGGRVKYRDAVVFLCRRERGQTLCSQKMFRYLECCRHVLSQ